jgi:hypothetical protein
VIDVSEFRRPPLDKISAILIGAGIVAIAVLSWLMSVQLGWPRKT